jgi:hypothetical protein
LISRADYQIGGGVALRLRTQARSAKNAFRHGLSLPVRSDRGLDEEVQALACEIAGPYASTHIQILTDRVAEAQVDVRRVRDLRHQFLSDKLSDPHYATQANVRTNAEVLRGLLRQEAKRLDAIDAMSGALSRDASLQFERSMRSALPQRL